MSGLPCVNKGRLEGFELGLGVYEDPVCRRSSYVSTSLEDQNPPQPSKPEKPLSRNLWTNPPCRSCKALEAPTDRIRCTTTTCNAVWSKHSLI